MSRLIDADETLSSLSNDLPYKGSVRRVLMQAPTVDGVHAHWIHHPDNLFPTESTMECSHCHEEETVFILNDNYCHVKGIYWVNTIYPLYREK